MTIEQFMQGLAIAVIGTFVLTIACVTWAFSVCLIGSVAFVIMLVSSGIEALVYIHQRVQLATKGRK